MGALVWTLDDGAAAGRWEAPSGGDGAGNAVVRGPFSFTHATPDLAAGIQIYVPTLGEILLNAFVSVDIAFDGTTPMADFGAFADGSGYFGSYAGGVDLTNQTGDDQGTGILLPSYNASPGGVFDSTDPVLVVASQNGTKDGTPIDSTVGSARFWLVTAIPTAF